jgi:hypothetical protein
VFADPAAKFTLPFQALPTDGAAQPAAPPPVEQTDEAKLPSVGEPAEEPKSAEDAKVVTLDAFRKK